MTCPETAIYAYANLDEIWFSPLNLDGDFCKSMENGFDDFMEMVDSCDIDGIYTIAHPDNWFLLDGVIGQIRRSGYNGKLFLGSPDMLLSVDDLLYPPLIIRRMANQYSRPEYIGGFHEFQESEALNYSLLKQPCTPDVPISMFKSHLLAPFLSRVGVPWWLGAAVVNHVVDPRWAFSLQQTLDASPARNLLVFLSFTYQRIFKVWKNRGPRPGKFPDFLLDSLVQVLFGYLQEREIDTPDSPHEVLNLIESFFDAMIYVWLRRIYPDKPDWWLQPNPENEFHYVWLNPAESLG